jgi:3-oxoacyl-[acyl-carrier-protein] synthase II
MNVAGIGVVFTCGRGIDVFEKALQEGWTSPPGRGIPSAQEKKIPVYSVERGILTGKRALKKMRRADPFSKMAVLAAWDAVEDSGIAIQEGKAELGIILATAFGPQVTAFRFLDEIIDYGDAGASPTLFSHSVQNAAASYIASALNNRGPTLTVTQFAFSFHQALLLARCWLEEGRCESVLVGSAEECGAVMEYVCREKLRIAEDGRIRSFEFSPSPVAVPGEGSAFLLLTRGDTPKRYCEISGVSFNDEADEGVPDLYILDADGMSGDETYYGEIRDRDAMIAGYAPIFGSMMTGSAFHCASAALMLMNQIRYACPVPDNPHGVRLCTSTERKGMESIQCIKYSCSHEKAVIEFKR